MFVACGVPKSAFEPYKLTISERRMRLLNLHLHPIFIHFPQAITILAITLLLSLPFFNPEKQIVLNHTALILISLLPFAVIGGFVTGLIDGKLRFKKVTTPILKIKNITGSLYILLSFLGGALIITSELKGMIIFIEIIILLGCTVCAVVLGEFGSKIMESKIPGQ
jgi:hypothetical protein